MALAPAGQADTNSTDPRTGSGTAVRPSVRSELKTGEERVGRLGEQERLRGTARASVLQRLARQAPPEPAPAVSPVHGNGAQERVGAMQLDRGAAHDSARLLRDERAPEMVFEAVRREPSGPEQGRYPWQSPANRGTDYNAHEVFSPTRRPISVRPPGTSQPAVSESNPSAASRSRE